MGARLWGCSSVGRAPALQAGGQGFESPHLHGDNEENIRDEIEREAVYESHGYDYHSTHLFLENRITN